MDFESHARILRCQRDSVNRPELKRHHPDGSHGQAQLCDHNGACYKRARMSATIMLYAIIWKDVENSLPLRQSVRPSHLEHVRELLDQGRLIVGGPFPAVSATDPGPAGFTGSLIIAEFPTQADAELWINEDAYMTAGVIAEVTVKPFVQVVP
jgi:uncharacterized protein YciI